MSKFPELCALLSFQEDSLANQTGEKKKKSKNKYGLIIFFEMFKSKRNTLILYL